MKIDCRSCGHPIEVTPPSKDYEIKLNEPCPNGDSIEVNVRCDNCSAQTQIYWDAEHELAV
ncbi:MAG: hypothetical protein JRN51_05700 [Nitrososphaerota archaeon]|nr:hypothetical protein [Nitrososphaerota archaeon]